MESFEALGEFAVPQQADEAVSPDAEGAQVRADAIAVPAIVIHPDANGVIVLPAGASLDRLIVDGRDLVIVLEDGTRISVLSDWPGEGDKQRFLREVRDGACGAFSTVLSPDYNAAHADHFHFDMDSRWVSVCR